MQVANSPLANLMTEVLNTRASVIIGSLAIDKSDLLWINDGLMAVFFYSWGWNSNVRLWTEIKIRLA